MTSIRFFSSFVTLVGDLLPEQKNSNNERRAGGGGSGPRFGGGPPGGTGRGQPAGYNRRIGRVVNMADCNVPGGG